MGLWGCAGWKTAPESLTTVPQEFVEELRLSQRQTGKESPVLLPKLLSMSSGDAHEAVVQKLDARTLHVFVAVSSLG